MEKKKLTAKDLLELKGKRKIVAASCFGYYYARAMEAAGYDVLGTTGWILGHLVRGDHGGSAESMADAKMAVEGVRRGAPNTFLFAVPPYGDHFLGIDDTLRLSAQLIKAGADAVKIQGSGIKIDKIRALTQEGIPCGGHLGLTPLYTTWLGGFRAIGKTVEEAVKVYEDALRVQDAGAIWIELECVPYRVAAEITKRVEIPILGIGSGPDCDGEIQVHLDTLGLHDGHYPKHSKVYMNHHQETIEVFEKYREEVSSGAFPTNEYGFRIKDDVFETFLDRIEKI